MKQQPETPLIAGVFGLIRSPPSALHGRLSLAAGVLALAGSIELLNRGASARSSLLFGSTASAAYLLGGIVVQLLDSYRRPESLAQCLVEDAEIWPD